MIRRGCVKKLIFVSFVFLLAQVLFYLCLAIMDSTSKSSPEQRYKAKILKRLPFYFHYDYGFVDEVKAVDRIWRDLGCSPFIVTSGILKHFKNWEPSSLDCVAEKCVLQEDVILGVDYNCIAEIVKFSSFFQNFRHGGFEIFKIESEKIIALPAGQPLKKKTFPIAFILRKTHAFVIAILHSREDNFWWHGSVFDDSKAVKTLAAASLDPTNVNFMQNEGAIPKMELIEAQVFHHRFLVPKNIPVFMKATSESASKFIECNYERADLFFRTYGRDQSVKAVRFKHQAWKLLSRAKTILSQLEVPFWLSSGTCLGYLRQCDFIPYSQDVDLGVLATDYNKDIIPAFLSHGFKLLHTFGKPNDSYQIAFEYNKIKLDLFFFYLENENKTIWNGGTEARSGKKFKYTFSAFSLCWTEFLELLVRVPCETVEYIEANYGSKWFAPVTQWSWKSSPPNVNRNGEWPKEEWSQVIKIVND